MSKSNEFVITELWDRIAVSGHHREDFKIERFSSNGGRDSVKNGVRVSSNDALLNVRCSLYRSYKGNLIAALRAVIALVESDNDVSS